MPMVWAAARHQWGVLTCFTQVKASKLLRALGGVFRLVSTIYAISLAAFCVVRARGGLEVDVLRPL